MKIKYQLTSRYNRTHGSIRSYDFKTKTLYKLHNIDLWKTPIIAFDFIDVDTAIYCALVLLSNSPLSPDQALEFYDSKVRDHFDIVTEYNMSKITVQIYPKIMMGNSPITFK